MRFLSVVALTLGLFSPFPCVTAQQTVQGGTDSLVLASLPDSALTSVAWEETTPGEREGYLLVLWEYGSFEEDAGERSGRSGRHLMGRWQRDSSGTRLTLGVDGLLGGKMVPRCYLRGRDFYIPYRILHLTPYALELEDELTGERRTFVAQPIADYVPASEYRKPQEQTRGPVFTPILLPGIKN